MKSVLIVVDYQNDFVSGSLGFPEAVSLEEPIAKKIENARKEGTEVVFTMDTHTEQYLQTQEGKRLPIAHCLKDSEGWQLYGRISSLRQPEDIVFEKPVFGSEQLMEFLKERQFERVELVGVVSNICVISNAVLAKTVLPEAEVFVDAQCVASNDSELNIAALKVMESLQITVENSPNHCNA